MGKVFDRSGTVFGIIWVDIHSLVEVKLCLYDTTNKDVYTQIIEIW